MSIKVTEAIFQCDLSSLNGTETSVLLYLALRFNDDEQYAWPTWARIRADLNIGKTALYTSLRRIQAAGFVTTEKWGLKGKPKNRYRLHWEPKDSTQEPVESDHVRACEPTQVRECEPTQVRACEPTQVRACEHINEGGIEGGIEESKDTQRAGVGSAEPTQGVPTSKTSKSSGEQESDLSVLTELVEKYRSAEHSEEALLSYWSILNRRVFGEYDVKFTSHHWNRIRLIYCKVGPFWFHSIMAIAVTDWGEFRAFIDSLDSFKKIRNRPEDLTLDMIAKWCRFIVSYAQRKACDNALPFTLSCPMPTTPSQLLWEAIPRYSFDEHQLYLQSLIPIAVEHYSDRDQFPLVHREIEIATSHIVVDTPDTPDTPDAPAPQVPSEGTEIYEVTMNLSERWRHDALQLADHPPIEAAA